MLIPLLIFQLLLPAGLPAQPGVEAHVWSATLHQVVVVKASTLMPPPLQRQILRYRKEILTGCLDVLRDGAGVRNDAQAITSACEELIDALGSRTPFSRVCYLLGRLSALAAEFDPPVDTALNSPDNSRWHGFTQVLESEYKNFPLVINREGEGYLLKGSLSQYLDYAARRNADRKAALLRALAVEKPGQWRDQRSLTYGLASLVYNDMVLDSARLWLFIWQQAGGEIGDAPYFKLHSAESK